MSSIIKPEYRGVASRQRPIVLEFPDFGDPTATFPEAPCEPAPEPEPPSSPDPSVVAAAVIADAERQAGEILAAAEAEAEARREAARREGRTLGEEEGRAAWTERHEELDRRAAEIEAERAAYYEGAEQELAALATDIARKVIKQELAQSPEAVLSVVRACMHRLKEKEARVRVCPKDLDTVRGARESFLGIADGLSDLEIVSDRRVQPGGCIVDTPSGSMDARLETQLEHIEQALAACEETPSDSAS